MTTPTDSPEGTPEDAAKLVERLRERAEGEIPERLTHRLLTDAIALIESLQASLRHEYEWGEGVSKMFERADDELEATKAELAAAKREAENVRARTIEECAKVCDTALDNEPWGNQMHMAAVAHCARKVRALAQRGQ